MVRLSANSIRVVGDAEDTGIDATPAENVNEPDHVGAWLREAREATGRDLRDVAAHLRIRYPYLLAIEEGRFDDLPGRAYIVGFIRSYAGHLGLDAEAMVARYKADADAVIAEQNLKFPTPAPEGRFPGSGALIASAILVAAAIGGWYYYQNRDAVDLDRVPEPPESAAIGGSATGAQPTPAEASGDSATMMATAEASAPTSDTAPAAASGAAAETASTMSAATEPPMPESSVSPGEQAGTMDAAADRSASETMAAAGMAAPTAPEMPGPETPAPAASASTNEQMMASGSAGATAPSLPASGTPAGDMPAAEAPAAEMPTGETPGATAPVPMAEPPAADAPSPAVSEPAPQPVASETVASTPALPDAAVPEPAEAEAVAPAPGETGADAPATSEPAVAATEAPQTAALPPPPPVAATGNQLGRVYGLTNRDARVVLTARGESWVQVRDSGQTVLFTRTLQSGESYRVPNRQGLLMRVGNPRMIDISIDGSTPVQLSDSDRPIQDVTLDPQVLREAIVVR